MNLALNESFKIEVPSEFSGLIHEYHNRLLADDSLADLDVVLLSLYLVEGRNRKVGVTYEDSKGLFTLLGRKAENYPANLHLGKKKNLIGAQGATLSLTINGVKRIREFLGQVGKAPIYVIKSGQTFTAIMLLEKFLSAEIRSEELLLCDPYISTSSLFPFVTLKGKVKGIKILTSNIIDSAKFNEYKNKLQKEMGISIEVRVNQKIHDRYLISGDKCWSIGSSIKDLGNKDTTVREISEVSDSMKSLFLERWNEP